MYVFVTHQALPPPTTAKHPNGKCHHEPDERANTPRPQHDTNVCLSANIHAWNMSGKLSARFVYVKRTLFYVFISNMNVHIAKDAV